MRVWIVSFIVLFGAAEFFQWFRQVSLPLPAFILGGAFLAVASNYNKLSNLSFHPDYDEEPKDSQPAVSPVGAAQKVVPPGSQPVQPSQPAPSISFTIRKPFHPED